MEPIKRITLGVFVLLVIGAIALFAIYVSVRKLEERARPGQRQEMEREDVESSAPAPVSGEQPLKPAEEKTTKESAGREISEPGMPGVSKDMETTTASKNEVGFVSEEELLKYLNVKEAVFSAYDEHRSESDKMLDQNRKWGRGQVHAHMAILGNMMVKKKMGLKKNVLKESRYNFISCAIFEWAKRTEGVPYERQYKGDESFYNKLSPVVPCTENDLLFAKHKESIAKTFMGDFELVDY